MVSRLRRSAAFLLAAVALSGTGGVSSGAHAAVSQKQAAASVEREFGVRVLKTTKGSIDGRSVWLLTVMTPGGNSNAAFQVNRLAVDVETGQLVSGFRHRSSGYDRAGGAGSYETDRQPTDVLRRGWNFR